MSTINVPIYGRIPVGSIATGGDVVALLIKLKKRRAAKLPPPGDNNYTPTQYDYLAIPVDAKLQESYRYEAEVTQFPVESGAWMSDHVIVKPLVVELVFEVSNANGPWDAIGSLELWFQQILSRQTVTLQTKHRYLENMVCTSIQADNEAPYWGKLSFRASFTQVTKITLTKVRMTEDVVLGTQKMTAITAQPNQPDLSIPDISDQGQLQPVSVTTATSTPTSIEVVKQYELLNSTSGAA